MNIFKSSEKVSINFFTLTKVLYDNGGLSLKSIQIALTALSLIQWTRSLFFLPVYTVPRELPEDYDLGKNVLFAKRSKVAAEQNYNQVEMQEKSSNQVGERLGLLTELKNEVKHN